MKYVLNKVYITSKREIEEDGNETYPVLYQS
jgi:hypothetical protein